MTPEYKVIVERETTNKHDPGYEHWYVDLLHYGVPKHIHNGAYTFSNETGRASSGWYDSEADAKRAGDAALRAAKKASGGGTKQSRNIEASHAILRRF